MAILRSILAVVAGFVTVVILSEGTDFLLSASKLFPPLDSTPMLAASTVYRSLAAIVGGYVTARLAPNNAMTHVWVLALIGFALAILGTVVQWKLGSHWYPIALVITALPCTWLGGRLAVRS